MQPLKSIAWARGFIVLVMAPVHTLLLYGNPDAHNSWLGKTFAFIAEGPGAPLLMVLMGLLFALSGKHTAGSVLKRSALLLLAACTLNCIKFVLPAALGWMPEGLTEDLQISPGIKGLMQLFLLGDVLHFAALAFPLLYIVHKHSQHKNLPLVLVLIVCIVAPVCWLLAEKYSANYLLVLAGGHPPQVFFPLFPWLAYPLFGMFLGQQIKNKDWVMETLLVPGCLLILAGLTIERFLHYRDPFDFYRPLPGALLKHIGIVCITLFVWDRLACYLQTNAFFRILEYLSKHITAAYIIQWIIICWMLPLFGYEKLDLYQSILAIIFTTSLTGGFLLSYTYLINRYEKNL